MKNRNVSEWEKLQPYLMTMAELKPFHERLTVLDGLTLEHDWTQTEADEYEHLMAMFALAQVPAGTILESFDSVLNGLGRNSLEEYHALKIMQALNEGKDVPMWVLAEYPTINKKGESHE